MQVCSLLCQSDEQNAATQSQIELLHFIFALNFVVGVDMFMILSAIMIASNRI